jgi:hypothetical protein
MHVSESLAASMKASISMAQRDLEVMSSLTELYCSVHCNQIKILNRHNSQQLFLEKYISDFINAGLVVHKEDGEAPVDVHQPGALGVPRRLVGALLAGDGGKTRIAIGTRVLLRKVLQSVGLGVRFQQHHPAQFLRLLKGQHCGPE